MPVETESLIEYPCDFPIKILGRTQAGFAQSVLEIVRVYAPDFDGATMEMRTSKKGKYLSVTCVIHAASRQQLDDLVKPDALGVDVAPRLKTLKVVEPGKRKAGVMVKDVAELVDKLKNEAKVI